MSAQDPRNKFKTDNYEKQEQEVPGIQAKMSHNQIVGMILIMATID